MPPQSFRSSASFGKRQEFVAIAELLRRGFDVYQTLVDDQAIDCILRREVGSAPKYVDIQIKARSKDTVPKDWALFTLGKIPRPRPNFLFMFFAERTGTYWIIPSARLTDLAYRKKTGKHVGDYSVLLGNRVTTTFNPRPKFREFEGEAAFRLLEATFDGLSP